MRDAGVRLADGNVRSISIDSLCPEAAVVVLLLSLRIRFRLRLRRFGRQHMDGVFISRVDICFRSRYGHLNLILVLSGLHHTQISRDFVVALRTPGNVAK